MLKLLTILRTLSPAARRAVALALAVFALVLALGAQTVRLAGARADLATEKAARSAETAQRAQAAASASEAYRTEEQRRVAAHQEISHVAELDQTRAVAERRTADSAGQRLQQRFAAAASRCAAPADPAAAPSSSAAGAAGDLLIEVQRRIDEAAGELADAADRARIAGLACERSYDALTAR